MERIILGFDGTPASVAALSWVAARASRQLVRVDLVGVLTRVTKGRRTYLDELGDAEAFLRRSVAGIIVQVHQLQGGVSDSLVSFAEHADLLVIGINPGHPIRATLAGALPLQLSTQTRVPVVMVPVGWVDLGEPVTVGVAVDDSSEAALAFAAREAESTGCALRLAHAWLMPAPTYVGGAPFVTHPETVMADHRAIVDAALSWVTTRYPALAVQTELIRESKSAALMPFTRESSLLVIGTHHHGILAGGLLGSVAQELLWRAECPLAVVPREVGVSRYEPGASS